MRRPAPARVYPTYDRNDLNAPSYVIGTPHGTTEGWCSGGPEAAQAILDGHVTSGTPILHAWINPGPDFVDRRDGARRAA